MLRSLDARTEEAVGLAGAIGIDVVGRKNFKLRQIRPASLFGKGQVEEIAELAEGNDAKLLVVDAALSPVQQKTLEEETKCKVIDRTGLILEIFG
jgi:GTP-binding protein HflX